MSRCARLAGADQQLGSPYGGAWPTVTWKGWPQTVPAESLLSNWKNRADVCEVINSCIGQWEKSIKNMMRLKEFGL